MIVLDVCLDNLFAFKNFHLNLTYPKKIVDSSIENEFLPGRSNFRYKKVNVIFGANASGKTTFGRVLMNIFNFIEKKNYDFIIEAICDHKKRASFRVDLASDDCDFYRVDCEITPPLEEKYSADNIRICVRKVTIALRDSYEICSRKIDQIPFVFANNYMEELEKIKGLDWLFQYPSDASDSILLPKKSRLFCSVLKNVLISLDPSITDVNISKDVDRAYVIHFKEKSIVLQHGQKINSDYLSSGTKAGVAVSTILYSLLNRVNTFYYCDEKFSYIHSEIEKAILSMMIDYIGPSDQLFFTTHNTDILDMNLPKHAFTFMRKDVDSEEFPITAIDASSLLKRNTDSLRKAVENDLFSTAPAVELIYSISELVKKG